ncbi:MAG: M23 family metallopeptidase [Cyanobacteria bacterium]|nr:M23 family metallopeptidase [Cyanobacteriota bacterium]
MNKNFIFNTREGLQGFTRSIFKITTLFITRDGSCLCILFVLSALSMISFFNTNLAFANDRDPSFLRIAANTPSNRDEMPLFDIPSQVKQGNTIPVVIRNAKGRFDGGQLVLEQKRVPLFLQETGDYVGLMPIGVSNPLGTFNLHVLDGNGNLQQTTSIQVLSAHFPKQNISVSKTTKSLEPLPGEMEAIGNLKNTLTSVKYWQEPFLTPTPDCMNSIFGVLRYHNGKATGDYHKGVDLRSPQGRPVKAITGGVVKISKMFRLHGGTIGLDHGQGISSIYIHLSKLAVEEGDFVKAGDTVGYVGSTGFATGPHLHWGLYVNGLPVNPVQWLKPVPRC